MGHGRYWLQTLGCPKNQVDSDKLAGLLRGEGYLPAPRPEDADVVVVNTCAFVEAARRESVEAVLELADARRPGARLVVTGCMAERYGAELADALPEADLVAGFGVPVVQLRDPTVRSPGAPPAVVPGAPPAVVPGAPPAVVPVAPPATTSRSGSGHGVPVALRPPRPAGAGAAGAPGGSFDLLALPRPPVEAPWAYVKVAEGCDRACGFCAIPSFRGKQRSRAVDDVMAEVVALGPSVREVVLVAQDLGSYGRDRNRRHAAAPAGPRAGRPGAPVVSLVREVTNVVPRVRLLYLYPSSLSDELVEAVLGTGVPYFDLSLQHVSRPLLARMRRWGDGDRFLERIAEIRRAEPEATFRSSFILGYPGETEADHDALLDFLRRAELDWAGFFPFSREDGTFAASLPDQVPSWLALERLRECAELQDSVTARRRDALVGKVRQVLVDRPGVGRTVHEAPEIDGVVRVPSGLEVGSLIDVVLTESLGTDLVGVPTTAGTAGAGGVGTGVVAAAR